MVRVELRGFLPLVVAHICQRLMPPKAVVKEVEEEMKEVEEEMKDVRVKNWTWVGRLR